MANNISLEEKLLERLTNVLTADEKKSILEREQKSAELESSNHLLYRITNVLTEDEKEFILKRMIDEDNKPKKDIVYKEGTE